MKKVLTHKNLEIEILRSITCDVVPSTSREAAYVSSTHTCPPDPKCCPSRPAALPILPAAASRSRRASSPSRGAVVAAAVATAAARESARCCHRRCLGAAESHERPYEAEGTREWPDRAEERACSPAGGLLVTCSAACTEAGLATLQREVFRVVRPCVWWVPEPISPLLQSVCLAVIAVQSVGCRPQWELASARAESLDYSPGRSNCKSPLFHPSFRRINRVYVRSRPRRRRRTPRSWCV